MSFYSGLAVVARRLLTTKGQTLTFSRETSTSFDHILGENTTSASTYTGVGAAFDYNSREIDGEVVQRGDIRLILEATTTPPIIDDATTIDGDVYRIMAVRPISPAGTVVIYEVQLRK